MQHTLDNPGADARENAFWHQDQGSTEQLRKTVRLAMLIAGLACLIVALAVKL
jgi:hypothetical protein